MNEDRGVILKALQKGIDEAMIQHKRAGLPVVIERDGKIEWVKPEARIEDKSVFCRYGG